MPESFHLLFSEYQIGNLALKNRIVFLPHATGFVTRENLPSEQQQAYFSERAKNGVGLIIGDGSQLVHRSTGNPWFVNAWDQRVVPIYRRITDSVHKYGAKMFCQIQHSGNEMLGAYTRKPLLAPSAIPDPLMNEVPKAMELEEIEDVIQSFGQAALHAKKGGYDGIEIKASHDGLIRQFWSPATNKRLDQYGGTLENRIRFSLEIIKTVHSSVGNDFPIGVRLSLDEMLPNGFSLDEGIQIGKTLAETGMISYLSTDIATISQMYLTDSPMCVPPGFALYAISTLKANVNIPVIAFGRINDPILAEKILKDGQADLIGMCRQLICDPGTPIKAASGKLDSIRYCIGCNQYCLYYLQPTIGHVGCIQNPAVGYEDTLGPETLSLASHPKNIVVIGGGPAGLKVAEIASKRGHNVIIYDENTKLGGLVNLIIKTPYRQEFEGIVRYLINEIEQLGVTIYSGIRADADMVLNHNPNAVVVATGSEPDFTCFSQMDVNNICSIRDVINGRAVGHRVILYDKSGHQEGLSGAEYLADRSKSVEVITPMPNVGNKIDESNLRPLLIRLMKKGVTFNVNEEITNYSDNVITVKNVLTDESRILNDVETLVISGLNKSKDDLYFKLKGKVNDIYRVGDCVAPRLADMAIWEGETVGRKL